FAPDRNVDSRRRDPGASDLAREGDAERSARRGTAADLGIALGRTAVDHSVGGQRWGTGFAGGSSAMTGTSDRTRTGMYGVWIGAAALGALALGLCAHQAQAVRTQFFRAEGYARFKSFTLEGVALTDQGQVRPGPAIQEMGELGVRLVWRLIDANGRLVASTGDQGKLFRQDGNKLVPLATLHNYELFALAADESGNVYAAGAPSGTIVRVAPD